MPVFLSEPKNNNLNNSLTSNSINLGSGLTNIDRLYVRAKGLETDDIETAIQITGFNISILGSQIKERLDFDDDFTDSGPTIIEYDGYQYVYYEHSHKVSGDFEALFFGSSIEIDKIYLFESLFEFPDDDTFIRMDMGRPERGAIIHEDLYRDYSKVKGRPKRSVSYTAEYQGHSKYRQFESFRDDNPHFFFLEDFKFFPERLYPAMLGRNLNVVYTIPNKLEGLNIDFDITER